MTLPDVVSRERWLQARVRLLAEEKELTRSRDALNAARRRLPMVRIEKNYVFDGADGPVRLADMFGDRSQLIVKHIMFGPDWDAPCPSCQHFIAELSEPVLARLHSCDTAFVLVSRAPLTKIEAFRAGMEWTPPWYSSFGTDFNYDFQVTLDETVPQLTYNYRPEPGLLDGERSCEMPGISTFLRAGGKIFHTYSAYARGEDHLDIPYAFLDLTALGRQEPWKEPNGRAPVMRS
jgi:predicted dithiol-disulfide oxidoreductase (DUF899 family)